MNCKLIKQLINLSFKSTGLSVTPGGAWFLPIHCSTLPQLSSSVTFPDAEWSSIFQHSLFSVLPAQCVSSWFWGKSCQGTVRAWVAVRSTTERESTTNSSPHRQGHGTWGHFFLFTTQTSTKKKGKAGVLWGLEISGLYVISRWECICLPGAGQGVFWCPSVLHTMNSLLPYNTRCCGMSGGSLPWLPPCLECFCVEYLAPFSFCLPFSGLKVPRLVNWGLSSHVPSCSPAGLMSKLSDRGVWDAFRTWDWDWAGPEPTEGDLEWNRNRRVVAAEEGLKCEDEEYEETEEQESTESRQSGCVRCERRLGLFPSDLRGHGEDNTGPLSEMRHTAVFLLSFWWIGLPY